MPCFLVWLFIFNVGEVEDNNLFICNDLMLIKATPEHFLVGITCPYEQCTVEMISMGQLFFQSKENLKDSKLLFFTVQII